MNIHARLAGQTETHHSVQFSERFRWRLGSDFGRTEHEESRECGREFGTRRLGGLLCFAYLWCDTRWCVVARCFNARCVDARMPGDAWCDELRLPPPASQHVFWFFNFMLVADSLPFRPHPNNYSTALPFCLYRAVCCFCCFVRFCCCLCFASLYCYCHCFCFFFYLLCFFFFCLWQGRRCQTGLNTKKGGRFKHGVTTTQKDSVQLWKTTACLTGNYELVTGAIAISPALAAPIVSVSLFWHPSTFRLPATSVCDGAAWLSRLRRAVLPRCLRPEGASLAINTT